MTYWLNRRTTKEVRAMALDQLARASRGVNRAVTAALCSQPSPRRQRVLGVAVVVFVAAHYRRPARQAQRDEMELAA